MAVQWISDLAGTALSYFRIGLSGVRLKNSSGNLLVRNPGDSADAEVTASKVKVSGDLMELNSDAAAAGADWKYTLQRPTSGMTAAVTLTFPPNDGTAGQVMVTDGSGNMTFESAGNTAPCQTTDVTALAFGTASPVAMFTKPDEATISEIRVIIDTAFDGTPSMSVGIAGTTSKYMASTQVDLTAAAATVFVVHPGLPAAADEDLIITYSAGGAAAGAARIEVDYAVPN